MAELKTKATDSSVEAFLDGIADEKKRRDAYALVDLMRQATKAEPKMWGSSIVGFGSYHYKYASGHEGDACLTGFSPRKAALSLYIMAGFDEYADLLEKLGKHKRGKGCLYVKTLDDVHLPTLRKLVQLSVRRTKKTYTVNKEA